MYLRKSPLRTRAFLAANRRNARKSPGPRSRMGKTLENERTKPESARDDGAYENMSVSAELGTTFSTADKPGTRLPDRWHAIASERSRNIQANARLTKICRKSVDRLGGT